MIKSKILTVLFFSIILNTFTYASDDYDDFEKYKNKYYKSDKYNLYKNFDFLDLNSIQYLKLKDILIEYNESYRKLHDYKEDVEDKIEDILESETFDSKEFANVLKDVKNKEIELETIKISKIHAILNKKQRKKLAKYVEEWELD